MPSAARAAKHGDPSRTSGGSISAAPRARASAERRGGTNALWRSFAQQVPHSALSQPNEPAERQAHLRADQALRGGASATNGSRVHGSHLPPGTPDVVTARADSGRPLGSRPFFESRFGTPFQDVRIHDDARAASIAEAADARAFTVGSHIFFNRGEYQPGGSAGQSLIAHELAHIEQGHSRTPRLWRQPKGTVELGTPVVNPPQTAEEQEKKEEWVRLQVFATGMDHAAQVLADATLGFRGQEARPNVFIGLHPKFLKVYDSRGKALGPRIKLNEMKGLKFVPGVYVQDAAGLMHALTTNSDDTKIDVEREASVIGERPFTDAEKKAMEEEEAKAAAEKRAPKPAPKAIADFDKLITEPERLKSMVARVPNALVIYFVPTYEGASGGKGGGEKPGLYASPIEGRGDGQPPNAPPWPVSVEGPKLVPEAANPTYSAKVDWSANGNYSNVTAQAISQVGESIHYKWEKYDITKYANEQIAKDPAGTKDDAAAKPERTLDQRIEEFKTAKRGTGTDVTGMGGANREFRRDFDDWWKDTQRARKDARDPSGDTVGERLSNRVANELTLQLAPISLLVTAAGAVLKWVADLFAGPRQQQEVPMDNKGIYLVRVISTPAIHEDTEGKPIVRPPSVSARVTEVTTMEKAVTEALDEPSAQLAELQRDIDAARALGNVSKAEYLEFLKKEAEERFSGSPLLILQKKRAVKQKELDEFRKNYPTLSDYSRAREVEMLDDQIARYEHHEKKRQEGATGALAVPKRLNATLISEVTGEQYPLLMSAGPMANENGDYRWLIADVTNREGDAYIGRGKTQKEAFEKALIKFGNQAAYGRGRIGVRSEGLGLEADAPKDFFVESAPADWALAEKRIDDLVTTLALLGLIVASAGTAGALIGAGVAAARLIKRWQEGRLYLDAATVSDALGVLGGIGAAGQLAGGLRVQKFDKAFAITQEGRATEDQIARAAKALSGAQDLAKGVDLANEVINYGGLLWGNVTFLDQMMDISEQERTGAITHAAARRQRASAISGVIQNNALFIAGNVMKAKQANKDAVGSKEKAPAGTEKPPSIPEKATVESTPTEKPAAEKPIEKPVEKVAEQGNKPAQTAGEPVPIGERRATLAEMQAQLPKDLQHMVVIDDTLHGDTVEAVYKTDKSGLVTEVALRCSPDARPHTVKLHTETVRTMQKYQGFSGRVRKVFSWISDLIGLNMLDPHRNPEAFEAKLEIDKLPKLIEAQVERMRTMEPDARGAAEAELAKLELQLDQNIRRIEVGTGQPVGFVASQGLTKAQRAKYAELAAKQRDHPPGSDQHKAISREMYELIGGDLGVQAWEKKVYSPGVEHTQMVGKLKELYAKLRDLTPGSDEHKAARRQTYEILGGDMPLKEWEKKIYKAEVQGAKKAAAAAKNAPPPQGDWPTMTADIEKAVDTAAARLRKQLGKTWLDPKIYGGRIHGEVARIIAKMKLPAGWKAIIETSFNKFGGIDPQTLGMTVKDFVKSQMPEYQGMLSPDLLNQKVGNLKPDLVLMAPDGHYVVWDLTSVSAEEHFLKTLLYSRIVGEGRFTQVGETYYRWQKHVAVNSEKQKAFTGPATTKPQSVVTLPEKQILSLAKQFAGQGTPMTSLPAGVSGAAELISKNNKVVGKYFDPQTQQLVDTTNFSIHYSEGGVFIRPEKP